MIQLEAVRAHEKENRLLLEFVRGSLYSSIRMRKLTEEKSDESYLLGQICMHDVAPIAYWVLKNAMMLHCFEDIFVDTLRMLYGHVCMRGMDCLNSLSEFALIFRSFESPYAFTKEAMLTQIYPQGVRMSDEYEILVSAADLRKTIAFLELRGFQKRYAKEDRVCLARPATGAVTKYTKILINTALAGEPEKDAPIIEEMLARAEPSVHTWQGNLYSLTSVDATIAFCTGIYKRTKIEKEQENRLFPNLRLFGELLVWSSRFMDRESERLFTEHAQEYGLQEPCHYAFLSMDKLFEI